MILNLQNMEMSGREGVGWGNQSLLLLSYRDLHGPFIHIASTLSSSSEQSVAVSSSQVRLREIFA